MFCSVPAKLGFSAIFYNDFGFLLRVFFHSLRLTYNQFFTTELMVLFAIITRSVYKLRVFYTFLFCTPFQSV